MATITSSTYDRLWPRKQAKIEDNTLHLPNGGNMGLIGDFLEFLGLGGISGVDYLFAAMAIIGTFLFLIYFALILIGGAADGALGAVGMDVDFDLGAEGVFHMLTLQGLLSFMMMFGIFGLAVSQSGGLPVVAILTGTVAGTASMWLIGKVFQLMKGLESDATVKHSQAIGAQGQVYMTILPGQSGQVQVEFQSALRTCSAVLEDDSATLETGKFVEVIRTIGETLIVREISLKEKSTE
jgi:membrane protein implicated in regulation of membrane protease activity